MVLTAFLLAIAGLVTVRVAAHVPAQEATWAPAGLDVLPFPGTADASPQTQIAFPELGRSQLKALTVTGSRSGLHRGRLMILTDRGGSAFVPARPFVNGEEVSVQVSLRSRATGTASGAPNAKQFSFSFAVAAPVRLSSSWVPDRPSARAAKADAIIHDVRSTSTGTHTFHSASWLHPPIVWTSGRDPDPSASGDIFGDAQNSIQAGPVILGPRGQLIWFDPRPEDASARDVEVQRYEGQSVLTFWQGHSNGGFGAGDDVLLNHQYQTVATVRAGNGYYADTHEFGITPQGTALIPVFAPVHADLTSVGGPRNGVLLDSIIQEIDIRTGRVVWEWHAYRHVHLAESYAGKPGRLPYDFFHLNSIQELPDGNLLISARHTWAVYEINKKTGKIVWVLGGKHSSFQIGRGANFEWQHDATIQPDGALTLLDNGAGLTRNETQSRALRIRLNFKTRQASLVHAYTNNPRLLALSQGSVQVLPDGNTFVGWGYQPYFTEFGRSGRQLFSAHFTASMQSYRGYRFQWWGQPAAPPDVSVAATKRGTTIYAAWNGATDVAFWRVLTGPTATTLTSAGQFRKTYFETKMWVRSTQSHVAVQALNQKGQILATSRAVRR